MIILGIDTSCDDTSIAVLDGYNRVLSDIVSSQVEVHALFGGVVPEIASRKHLELIGGIYREALQKAGVSDRDIDLITVTNGPGLIGSLLIGLSFAKGLALSLSKPIIGVNHIEAHAMSIFAERYVDFPYIALVVSGGHTVIMVMEDFCRSTILGTTRDDAAGEAFDKISKYLNIGYPGGKVIEDMAKKGKRDAIAFPRPMITEDNYDFSFSGLKTSFLNYDRRYGVKEEEIPDLLASFQESICDVLVSKTIKAAKRSNIKRIVVGGGVAANGRLREMFFEKGGENGLEVIFPSHRLCGDNGIMVAVTGYFYFQKGFVSPIDMKAYSRITLTG
ncbi:MAG: tRNA (adenosine(37)-N6)-threonylcarbamoyltransferase complex transferase subunit TsaD [Syntrophorhabdaceae bacterium]|nr:tRNA (adenosine(37)-N6)-threonylcarbamoyltransferase complex transferase subunit TsaD [Syntrophorhabdaceae bacterium]